jgi:restriction system protein
MGWREFEEWTAAQFADAGYQPNTTPRTGDKGADIILRAPFKPGARPIICQCKHRALGDGHVDEEAITDVMRAQLAYGLTYPWLKDPQLVAVTNGRFTLRAAALARENDVLLVDGARIDGLAGIARAFIS